MKLRAIQHYPHQKTISETEEIAMKTLQMKQREKKKLIKKEQYL